MLARLLPNGRAEEIPGAVQTFRIKAHGAPAQPTMVFRLYYTEEVNTNSGVFYLWLDTSSNLQRLNLDGLPYNLDVEIVTPTPIVSGQRHCQMNRLVEAAHQTHMNFLADWFPLDENEPLVQFRAHRGLRGSGIFHLDRFTAVRRLKTSGRLQEVKGTIPQAGREDSRLGSGATESWNGARGAELSTNAPCPPDSGLAPGFARTP